jgi:hypothetical protein
MTVRPGRRATRRRHSAKFFNVCIDRLVVGRVEAGRRLVQEQQRRPGQQFQRHRRPFLLAAGEAADRRVGVGGEAELTDDLLDPGLPFRRRGVGGEAELRAVRQGFPDGELVVQGSACGT